MLKLSRVSRHLCQAIKQAHRGFLTLTSQCAELASGSAPSKETLAAKLHLIVRGEAETGGERKICRPRAPRHIVVESLPFSTSYKESGYEAAAEKLSSSETEELLTPSRYTGVRYCWRGGGAGRWRGQVNVRRNPALSCSHENKWILTTPMHFTEEDAAVEVACLRYLGEKLGIGTRRRLFQAELPESKKRELDLFAKRGLRGLQDFMFLQRQSSRRRSRVRRGEALGCRYQPQHQSYRMRFQRNMESTRMHETRTFPTLAAAAKCYDRLCYVFDRIFWREGIPLKTRQMNVGLSEEEMKYLDNFEDWDTFVDIDRLVHGNFPRRKKPALKSQAVKEFMGTPAFSNLWEKSKLAEFDSKRLRRESLDYYRRRSVFPPYGVMDVTNILSAEHSEGQRQRLLKWTQDVKEAAIQFIIQKLLNGRSMFAQRSIARDRTDILITPARGPSAAVYNIIRSFGLPPEVSTARFTGPHRIAPGTDRNKYWAPILAGGSTWLQLSVLVAFQKYHDQEFLYCMHVSKESVRAMRRHPILLWISQDMCWLFPPEVVSTGILPEDFEGGFLGIRRETAWELREYSMFRVTEVELADRLNTIYLEAKERMVLGERLSEKEWVGQADDPLATWRAANDLDDGHEVIQKIRAAQERMKDPYI